MGKKVLHAFISVSVIGDRIGPNGRLFGRIGPNGRQIRNPLAIPDPGKKSFVQFGRNLGEIGPFFSQDRKLLLVVLEFCFCNRELIPRKKTSVCNNFDDHGNLEHRLRVPDLGKVTAK